MKDFKRANRTLPVVNNNPLVRQLFLMMDQIGISQAALATKIGTDQGTISAWRRKANPTLPLFMAAVEVVAGRLVILPMDTPPK